MKINGYVSKNVLKDEVGLKCWSRNGGSMGEDGRSSYIV